MVHILKRMRKLREVLWIRVGPGALLLPKEVTKISMEFNRRLEGGHRGARKFWREMLPRIKFRNPAIPIEISRHNDEDGPSLLHIYTSTDSSAAPGAETARTTPAAKPTHTIDIRHKPESEILDILVTKTGAVIVPATPEELQEIEELEEAKKRSDQDRKLMRDHFVKERREAELLRLARGEMANTN